MSYWDIYNKRLNRWGTDYQSRVQGEREELFDYFLKKTIYRVDFYFDGNEIEGSLEKWKQDETKTLQYLKVRRSVEIPNGTVLEIPNRETGEVINWMIYYEDQIEASGYNKYIVLRMTHHLTWTARDGSTQESWAYMYGQEDNMLKDEIRSRSRMNAIYTENLKMSFYVMPLTSKIKKDDYFIIGSGDLQEQYRVTGYDIQSTPGVMYVTVDPTYEYDLTPAPEPQPGDNPADYFWLDGGRE